ncbi:MULTISPECIES: hypothetical protein [unclassified Streptomyces]|uniref:hypothetical protein n=1 Tax=unclassified Streptomyces TaxID=2593676 RepID=UPI00093D6F70|nr:hypothetical protein [Streptomyces sp. TSRI0281]OKI34745.1 hypothetical protein A6A29_14835 [Streptomyces sp. TSRI0281]
MLCHVIAPSSGYTKASNNVVRERRLNSDAKILLLYVQGLPESATGCPLGELAHELGMKGHAYQKAKKQLVAQGFVHEWSGQRAGGRWYTEQLFTNTPLTEAEARAVRARLTTAPAGPAASPAPAPPTVPIPIVGEPTPRTAGRYQPVEDNREKTTTHPPSEAEAAQTAQAAVEVEVAVKVAAPQPAAPAPSSASPSSSPAQLARAEQILLSLRHTRRELHLGVREARALAVEAVKWLERGLGEADLRQALLAERPEGGVRSAVGFLRYRLAQKCPEPPQAQSTQPTPPITAPPPVRELIACEGPGEEHVFRPMGDETACAECRQVAAWEMWQAGTHTFPEDATWRERFAIVRGQNG